MKRMFTCSVGCHHAIEIERWENDEGTGWEDVINGGIELLFWEERPILRDRIKQAWRMLRGMRVLVEGIALTQAEAQDMARYLLSLSSAAHPQDARRETATNAQASTTCTCLNTGVMQPKSLSEFRPQ